MVTDIINQLCLSCFNLINSRVDAYRILKNKTIAHGINFGAYFLFSILLYFITIKPAISWAAFPFIHFTGYILSAFFGRQITFDIPLNLRRGLKWYCVSTDDPPKAWLDRQERKVFGKDGRTPVFIYAALWIVSACITHLRLIP